MRKVILSAAITLDGCIARPDGSVDYLKMTKEGSAWMAGFFSATDTIVMGRKTLDAAIAMSGGSYKSPVKIPTYFFSRTQPPGESATESSSPIQSPATWLAQDSLHKRKERDAHHRGERNCFAPRSVLREFPKRGKHIFHMGGGELARSILQSDLIDGVVPGRRSDFARQRPSSLPRRFHAARLPVW